MAFAIALLLAGLYLEHTLRKIEDRLNEIELALYDNGIRRHDI